MAMEPKDIDVLIVAAQGGDREAFATVVVELYPQLAGFLAFHAPTPELMDEVVQASFVTAFEKLLDYKPVGTFAGWLKGIARNTLRRELARRRRHSGADIEVIDALLADESLQHLEREVAMAEERQQLFVQLRSCLDKLSPRMRMIAERRFVEDISLNQLAQQFKQSRASIAKMLFVLRRDLRACAEVNRGKLANG
jgi:RNA polymerase sigma-70 factor, ECF subfamily